METTIEKQRRLHEEIEQLERAAVEQILKNNDDSSNKTRKEQILGEHKVKVFLEDIQEKSAELLKLYEDADGSRQRERAALSGPDEFSTFYDRLADINKSYKANPNVVAQPADVTYENEPEGYAKGQLMVRFTDEEGFGRYLDLHEQHNMMLNLYDIFQERPQYLAYLTKFDKLAHIPKANKGNNAYRNYVQSLHDYLVDFYKRALPLENLDAELVKVDAAFEHEWQAGTLPGWEKDDEGESSSALFCVACGKQFAKDTVYKAHLTGKKHLKAAEKLKQSGQAATIDINAEREKYEQQEKDKQKPLAMMEARIVFLSALLDQQRSQTLANVERKQARTADELEEEQEEEEVVTDDEDDEFKAPSNPKNLPLGWDGKPIPYWLYKLHGLNITYKCEICGGAEYKGPKMFQKHFQEAKHAFGMRQLGIPNTIAFLNITTKEDALNLWEKIKSEKGTNEFKADVDEECEDSLGNVISKKTYEMLRINGLL